MPHPRRPSVRTSSGKPPCPHRASHACQLNAVHVSPRLSRSFPAQARQAGFPPTTQASRTGSNPTGPPPHKVCIWLISIIMMPCRPIVRIYWNLSIFWNPKSALGRPARPRLSSSENRISLVRRRPPESRPSLLSLLAEYARQYTQVLLACGMGGVAGASGGCGQSHGWSERGFAVGRPGPAWGRRTRDAPHFPSHGPGSVEIGRRGRRQAPLPNHRHGHHRIDCKPRHPGIHRRGWRMGRAAQGIHGHRAGRPGKHG